MIKITKWRHEKAWTKLVFSKHFSIVLLPHSRFLKLERNKQFNSIHFNIYLMIEILQMFIHHWPANTNRGRLTINIAQNKGYRWKISLKRGNKGKLAKGRKSKNRIKLQVFYSKRNLRKILFYFWKSCIQLETSI